MNLSFERFLGTSGQNVCDIQRYSSMDSHLEILEETLQLRHLAPTAPDTLGGWVRRKESLLLGLCGLKLFFCFRLLPFLSERSIYFGGMSACLLQRQRSDLWVQTHQRSVRDALTVWNTSTQGGGGHCHHLSVSPIRSWWSRGSFGDDSRVQQHSNSLSGQLTHSSVWANQLHRFFCWQRWRKWDEYQPLTFGRFGSHLSQLIGTKLTIVAPLVLLIIVLSTALIGHLVFSFKVDFDVRYQSNRNPEKNDNEQRQHLCDNSLFAHHPCLKKPFLLMQQLIKLHFCHLRWCKYSFLFYECWK